MPKKYDPESPMRLRQSMSCLLDEDVYPDPTCPGGSYSGECTADAKARNGHFAGVFAASTRRSGEIPSSIRGDLAHPRLVTAAPSSAAPSRGDVTQGVTTTEGGPISSG